MNKLENTSLISMFFGHAVDLLIDLGSLSSSVIKFCFSPVFLLLAVGKIIARQIRTLFGTNATMCLEEDEISRPHGVMWSNLETDITSAINHVIKEFQQEENRFSWTKINNVPARFKIAVDAPMFSFLWVSAFLVLDAFKVIADATRLVSSAFIYPAFALVCAFKGQTYSINSADQTKYTDADTIQQNLKCYQRIVQGLDANLLDVGRLERAFRAVDGRLGRG